jgi:hypothetical protein
MRIFPPKSYTPHAAFGGIIIDAEATIIEIRAQPLEAGQAIADCASQGRLTRDLCELAVKPCFKIVDERCCQILPDGLRSSGGLPRMEASRAYACL